MTSKRVLGILTVIAVVAMSATGAQAGHGGVPSALTSFFLCKSISGQAVGERFDIQSNDGAGAGWGATLTGVKIGVATLACSFARLFPSPLAPGTTHKACPPPDQIPDPTCDEINPIPTDADSNPVLARDLKCYAISVGRGQGPQPNYKVTDPLLEPDQIVSGSGFNYLCAPAKFNQIVPQ